MKEYNARAGRRRMQQGLELFIRGLQAEAHGGGAGAHGTATRRTAARNIATRHMAARVAQTWQRELLSGYRQEPERVIRPLRARVQEDLVAVRGIEFASICRHHLLPFFGSAHIAYAPDGKITGLSRLGRLVDCLSRRLQLQETLTRQIVEALQAGLRPRGAACVVEATHTCMTMRRGRKSSSRIVTAAFSGSARRNPDLRRELMALCGHHPPARRSARKAHRGRRVIARR